MTKQNWLFALLIGSSIGCVCGADQSPAQSLTWSQLSIAGSAKPRGRPFQPAQHQQSGLDCGRRRIPTTYSTSRPSGAGPRTANRKPILAVHRSRNAWRHRNALTQFSPKKNEIGWLAGASDIAAMDPNVENFCGWVCSGNESSVPLQSRLPRVPVARENQQDDRASSSSRRTHSHATASNNNRQIAGIAENGIMDPVAPVPGRRRCSCTTASSGAWTLRARRSSRERCRRVQGDVVSAGDWNKRRRNRRRRVGRLRAIGSRLRYARGAVEERWHSSCAEILWGVAGSASVARSTKHGQVVGVSFFPGTQSFTPSSGRRA